MKFTERIRSYNQLEITLLAVFVSTILSIGFSVWYIYWGLADIYTRNADEYYGGYIGPDGDGSFLMDVLLTVLLFAVLVVISLAIKKKQSRFLLMAMILLLIQIPLSQPSLSYVSSVFVCGFGYFYMKKEERDAQYQTKKSYLLTVIFYLYIIDAILCGGFLAGYLINVIPNMGTGDLSTNLPFQEDTPDWVSWGIGSTNTVFNIFDLIISIVPFILMITAVVFVYRGIRRRGHISSKLGAAAFLLYVLILELPYGEVDSLILALFLPEALLSLYLLIRREPRDEMTRHTTVY
jgi:hypothetical protein